MSLLDDVRVPSPCDAAWEDMNGDGAARLCGRCDTLVHDLDAMDRVDAAQLLAAPGPLCVRKSGVQLQRPSRAGRRAVLTALAALSVGALAGCGPRKVTVRVEEPTPAVWPVLDTSDATIEGAMNRGGRARKFLLDAGWTRSQIRAEVQMHVRRTQDPGHAPPADDSPEARLYALLAAIAADPNGDELGIQTGIIGRRR